MMQIIKTALLLVLISPVVLAQEIRPLDSILATIRSKNPLLQGYDYQMEAIQAYAERAKGWSAPMVGAGSFMTPYPGQAVIHRKRVVSGKSVSGSVDPGGRGGC